ncbi:MAG: low affinity iron permease family protein [Bacteroidetes bacterium]|nr:low affinity iron permease family protein [Bacteroidota bacterium]MBS1629363.1 low affinity iron permease family protein [Bacteroidota bacterium]
MKSQQRNVSPIPLMFDRFSTTATRVTGRPAAFILAVITVLVWAMTGPLFGFSDTWQLVINTGTTIITFMMVFVIQQSQNKDTVALHLKLNELIASNERASNRLIDIEDLTEEELTALKKFYIQLSELAEKEGDLFSTHSVDEALEVHRAKHRSRRHNVLTDAPGHLHPNPGQAERHLPPPTKD